MNRAVCVLWSLACAGAAAAQAPSEGSTSCPAPSAGVRWESMRLPSTLLCRGFDTGTGEELLSFNVSPESPFRPTRSDRAEGGRRDGREFTWYRSPGNSSPDGQAREALFQVAEDRVMHVSIRARNQQELEQRQRVFDELTLPTGLSTNYGGDEPATPSSPGANEQATPETALRPSSEPPPTPDSPVSSALDEASASEDAGEGEHPSALENEAFALDERRDSDEGDLDESAGEPALEADEAQDEAEGDTGQETLEPSLEEEGGEDELDEADAGDEEPEEADAGDEEPDEADAGDADGAASG